MWEIQTSKKETTDEFFDVWKYFVIYFVFIFSYDAIDLKTTHFWEFQFETKKVKQDFRIDLA